MDCPNCRRPVVDEAEECPGCGVISRKLREQAARAAAPAPQDALPARSVPPEPLGSSRPTVEAAAAAVGFGFLAAYYTYERLGQSLFLTALAAVAGAAAGAASVAFLRRCPECSRLLAAVLDHSDNLGTKTSHSYGGTIGSKSDPRGWALRTTSTKLKHWRCRFCGH